MKETLEQAVSRIAKSFADSADVTWRREENLGAFAARVQVQIEAALREMAAWQRERDAEIAETGSRTHIGCTFQDYVANGGTCHRAIAAAIREGK